MKVSIVVPAYNEENYIGACLERINSQYEPADEIIVVDNNSHDSTGVIAATHGATVLIEKKQGLSHARNAGFDMATGDVILRCDADTLVPPDWVKKVKIIFSNPKVVGASGPGYFYGAPLSQTLSTVQNILFFKLTKTIIRSNVLYGPNYAVSKKCWSLIRDKVNNNDSEVHEDMEVTIKLRKLGKIVYDSDFSVQVSGRRISGNPTSFFVEYPTRWVHTVLQPATIL